jgi:hypothetical protein
MARKDKENEPANLSLRKMLNHNLGFNLIQEYRFEPKVGYRIGKYKNRIKLFIDPYTDEKKKLDKEFFDEFGNERELKKGKNREDYEKKHKELLDKEEPVVVEKFTFADLECTFVALDDKGRVVKIEDDLPLSFYELCEDLIIGEE